MEAGSIDSLKRSVVKKRKRHDITLNSFQRGSRARTPGVWSAKTLHNWKKTNGIQTLQTVAAADEAAPR